MSSASDRPDSPPAATAAAPPRHRRGARRLAIGLAIVATLVVLVIGAAWWALQSASGTAWLLSRVPGLEVTSPRGSLIGDFDATEVTLRIPGSGRLRIRGLRWHGLAIGRAPVGMWLRISIRELRAGRVEWQGDARPAGAPAGAPTSLELPVEVDIASLRAAEIRLGGNATPLLDLNASLHLGAELGSVHRVDKLAVTRDRIRISGSGQIATAAPLQLETHLEAVQAASAPSAPSAAAPAAAALPSWTAVASAVGPLAAPLVQATVRAAADGGRAAQSLDARATVRPFAAWPLGALELTAKSLDLSAFDAALPLTSLSGEARAQTQALDRPGTVAANLQNAAAGRWTENRLPVRNLRVEVRARPDDLGSLDVQALAAELGDRDAAAGRIEGSGRWNGARWALDARLVDVRLPLLDARAPALTLGGTLALRASGPAAPVEIRATVDGRMHGHGPARPVRLRLDGAASAQRIEIRSAELRDGTSSASVDGVATRTAPDAAWQIAGHAALVRFDPTPWLPAGTNAAWRRGPHRLNAQGRFDLAVPASPGGLPWWQTLAGLRGDAGVTLGPSVLAGLPVHGEASWRNRDGASALARLALDADGNAMRLEGRLGLDAKGSADAWDASIDAPALPRLAPLWRLLGATAAPSPAPSGSLSAQVHVDGRWPALSSRGELHASELRIGAASARRAEASWQLGTVAGAPVRLEATLGGAALDGPSIESMQVRLNGSAEAHRLDVRIESRGLPPAWTDALQAAPALPTGADAGSLAVLRADGGLIGTLAEGPAGWRGKVAQVEVRNAADGAAAWLRAGDLGVDAHWAGGPARLVLAPGRAELLGAGLRWSRFDWQAAHAATPMRVDVQAEIDPVPVAPILRRLQPGFGWGGDLTVAGRIDIRSAPAVSADVVLERRTGDLNVTDEIGTQALGLTDLRLGLAAAGGVWNFTQALAGTTLGVAAGAVVARTPPGATWPSAQTPIEGVLEVQVANLGAWGNWVPAGWRLGGALQASASIGGRVGAPEYTGSVVGHALSVRNFLQGVNVADGEVAIALRGTSARIDRFTARAGTGTLALHGEASLGEAPQARLRLEANRFQVLGRVDRRIVASGNGQVRLDRDSLAVDGRFAVDEGLIDFTRSDAPSLGDDVQVIRRMAGPPAPSGNAEAAARRIEASAAAPAAAVERKVALDLQVGMGQNLRVRGRGLDAGLRGDLHITSPGNRLAVTGTVYTVDGTYAAYGQKLTIDRGQLMFSGAIENPRLDIEATRPDLDIRVGVAVTGTALNPRVRLFSEPEQSEMDKLSWLVLGRASEGLGRTDTALLQRAALALLAGEGTGKSNQIVRSLGLDDLSVRQSEGEVRETIVSLGKQLSRRWYVGYERGLNATTGSWQLIYRIARRFTLRAQSGDENSVDLIWTWRWQ